MSTIDPSSIKRTLPNREGGVMEKLEDMYVMLKTELISFRAIIESKIISIDEKMIEMKEDVKELQKSTLSHHEQLERSRTLSDFFWLKIIPNLGWILAISAGLFELKNHLPH